MKRAMPWILILLVGCGSGGDSTDEGPDHSGRIIYSEGGTCAQKAELGAGACCGRDQIDFECSVYEVGVQCAGECLADTICAGSDVGHIECCTGGYVRFFCRDDDGLCRIEECRP